MDALAAHDDAPPAASTTAHPSEAFLDAANGRPAHVVALKCDGCVARVRRGEMPACAEACNVGALVYGELNDLVKAGRLRETRAVLTATAVGQPAAPATPETVGGWRTWGAEATQVGAHNGALAGGAE